MTQKNSNLQRWITGLVLAAALLAIIIFGSLEVLTILIALIISGGLWEYNRIVSVRLLKKKYRIIFALLYRELLSGRFQYWRRSSLSWSWALQLFMWKVTKRLSML